MIGKLGRIIVAEIMLGGRYNSELGIFISAGADRYNGQPDSQWSVDFFESVPHVYSAGGKELAPHLVGYISSLLTQADVETLGGLVDKPVICFFDEQGRATSWTFVKTTDG